ncbi:phage major tail tube protein [Campylobacter fetus]|uniref:Phage tail protein n=1 Tax=Campylobacter fetus subsp. testudinum TaxID=1507806 RepID=A0AAX0H9G1_CAMFE|nr:phage major tail tube protein [Campylobacter fetus]OCR90209.1 phage tail protein [Campylobacter fetus subsp. testudinum]OCR91836.1 phage tail protein [Campylobacter fetus subsp. testudinum]OCR93397.1 phage tail protein [Campylobacter fetus subsp. testudinum]OCS02703.1 phage tail protein [Campylobacter fetus subsp. testudinum]
MSNITAGAITGGNLFIEGIGMFGDLVSTEMPKFEHETIEASTNIGKYELVLPTLKPLSAKFTISNVNMIYFDLLLLNKTQKIYVKNNISSMNGVETGVVATFEGNLKILEMPNFEMNKEAQMSFEMSCTFVKYEVDKKAALVYDAQNGFYVVDGIDQYEKIRKNIN